MANSAAIRWHGVMSLMGDFNKENEVVRTTDAVASVMVEGGCPVPEELMNTTKVESSSIIIKDYGDHNDHKNDFKTFDEYMDDGEDSLEDNETVITAGTLPAFRELQPAFQPASTNNDTKNMRYLVWNAVGTITSRLDSLGKQQISIRFVNTGGKSKNECFPDLKGYIMAALSHAGAIFATGKDLVKVKRGSTIDYRAFSANKQLEGVNVNYSWTLSREETVHAVAAGLGWIAVTTSKNYLRIFTSTGIETKVICLNGPIVCMTGTESYLALVYHAGNPMNNAFQMQVDLFEFDWKNGCSGKSIVKFVPLPMSEMASLAWIGFGSHSKTLLLTIMDSNGVVTILTKTLGYGCCAFEWSPVLDMQQDQPVGATINHWPVYVWDDKLVFATLSGAQCFPTVYPQPVVFQRQFLLPVNGEKLHSMVWNNTITAHLEAMVNDLTTAGQYAVGFSHFQGITEQLIIQRNAADRALLVMLQDAVVEKATERALNLALKLRSTKAMEAAIQIANCFSCPSVAAAVQFVLVYTLEQQRVEQQRVEQQRVEV